MRRRRRRRRRRTRPQQIKQQQHMCHTSCVLVCVLPSCNNNIVLNEGCVCRLRCAFNIIYYTLHREQQFLWRQEDVEQRHLENARVLWARILERNRRDVEEKSEQLKAISTLAALISGFALTAFLQFDFGSYQDSTGFALPIFGISMALTVRLRLGLIVCCTLQVCSRHAAVRPLPQSTTPLLCVTTLAKRTT